MSMLQPEPKVTRVACYSRVSTREQVEGFSLDVQREAMERFVASQEGWTKYRHYCDEGISGTTDNRPEFQRMLRDAKAGLFDVVLVHKLDRVSRTLFGLMRLVSEDLEPAGIGFKSVSEPMIDTSTPMGRLLMQQLGAIAEFEVTRIRERTREGKHKTAELGRFNGGTRPYGYQVRDKKLTPVPEEAKVVHWIFEQYATGHRGTRSISVELNRDSVPTVNGGRWAPGTVAYLLSNPAYIGTSAYYKRRGWKAGRPSRKNPLDTWLVSENTHQAIIDHDLWDSVQRVLAKRRSNGNPNRVFSNKYLLTGILYCDRCKRPMWGRSTKNRGYSRLDYACQTFQTEGKATCPQHNVACETIDAQVLGVIRDFAEDDGFAEAIEQDLLEMARRRNPDSVAKTTGLETQLALLDKQAAKVRELCLREMVTEAEFEAETRRIKAEKDVLVEQLVKLKEQAVLEEWHFVKAKTVSEWLKNLDQALSSLDPDEKRAFVKSFVERVYVQDGEIAVVVPSQLALNWLGRGLKSG